MTTSSNIDSDSGLVISADISCLTCDTKTSKVYEPRITWDEYIDDKPKLLCSKCNCVCISIPHFDNELPAEEWRSGLMERYQNLVQVTNDNLPGLWDSLEFELSVQKILNIKDCTLPFAGIVLGRPSSLKTVGIDLFRQWPNTYYTDNFSAKAFVSHSTAVKREELDKIDMLPKIKNKLFLTPELLPTFSKKDDDLIDVLGILTRVLDGHGYESDTGAHGHRGYNEPMMFTWIGAAVDIPYKVHKYLGTLSPKLYFLRLPSNKRSEEQYLEEIDKKFEEKKARVQVALFDYLNWFEKGPELEKDEKSDLLKIEWDFKKNEKLAKQYVVKLGILLAHLRGVVPTWHTEDKDGLGYGYALATVEEPDRAITQLMNLARGHALSQGRNYVTLEDISIVIKVVFSTASLERVRIFELLVEHKGKLTTSKITDSLKIADNTAKRVMAEFRANGLVDVEDAKIKKDNNVVVTEKQIVLDKRFSWFITKEFSAVRNLPPYYSKKDDDKEGLGGHFSDSVNSKSRPKPELEQEDKRSLKINPPNQTTDPSTNSKPPIMQTCGRCGEELEAYYMRIHRCEGTD